MTDRLRVKRSASWSYDIVPYPGMSAEETKKYELEMSPEGVADMLRHAPPDSVLFSVAVEEIDDL